MNMKIIFLYNQIGSFTDMELYDEIVNYCEKYSGDIQWY